jgi:hypothetical protein
VIHLEIASEVFHPLAIAIIGYAGGKPVVAAQLRDVKISRDDAVHLKVQLVDVSKASDDTSPPQADAPQHRVHVWPRRAHGPDHVGCAVYQTWLVDNDTGKGKWNSHYYGPLDDPDCDDQEIECDKYWFDRNVGTRAPCLFDLHPDRLGGCRVGVSTCEDGKNATPGCALDASQSNHCFDDALCAACEGATNVEACIIDQVTTSAVAAFTCTFTPPPSFLPCTQGENTVVLVLPQGCIGTDNFRLRLLQDDPLGLTTPGSTSVVVNGVTITGRAEADTGGPCRMYLEWEAGSADMHPGADLMLDLWYPYRHLFIPLHIDFAAPAQCTGISLSTECDADRRAYMPADLECL